MKTPKGHDPSAIFAHHGEVTQPQPPFPPEERASACTRPRAMAIEAWRLWWVVAAVACLHLQAAFANARVRVEANEAVIGVYAEIDARVDRDLAWAVLTDYNRWCEFIPDLHVCRVISQPGEPIRLEQRGSIPWLPNFPLVMIALVEENPPRSIRFQRLAGNIRALAGEWQIQGKSPVRLVYRATVIPGFPMPPEASIEIFRHDAKVRLEAMAREMERRAGVGRKP
jgi:hypothetical protein